MHRPTVCVSCADGGDRHRHRQTLDVFCCIWFSMLDLVLKRQKYHRNAITVCKVRKSVEFNTPRWHTSWHMALLLALLPITKHHKLYYINLYIFLASFTVSRNVKLYRKAKIGHGNIITQYFRKINIWNGRYNTYTNILDILKQHEIH